MRIEKYYISVASLCITVSAIAATRVNPPAPDYYINNLNQCVVAPQTLCEQGDNPTCNKIIPSQGVVPKAIFAFRHPAGICFSQLEAYY